MARWTMTVTVAAVGFVLAVSERVDAATIYGTIQSGSQPVTNAPVSLTCPGAEARPTNTDGRGTYRLTVGRTGRCTLQIRGVSAQVILYEDPTRYDFEIVGGAQPRLIRR